MTWEVCQATGAVLMTDIGADKSKSLLGVTLTSCASRWTIPGISA